MSNLFFSSLRARLIAACAITVLGAFGGGVAAQAQDVPSYAHPEAPPPLPSYAKHDEVLRGRISAINGKYNVSVRDDRGYVDNISLHDGTVINPRGFRLAPGVIVTVYGHTSGSTFNADEIDTPYHRAYAYGSYPVAPVYFVGVHARF